MAINRFYRPSQARYTSQFVEEQYPVDLMMRQGAMKYGQMQQFFENVGKLSALNSSLMPGYRTTRIAPKVRQKYEGRIQGLTEKYADSYDSPQAVMEFSRLRNEWANDPNVQVIKYDREVGNAQRDKMLADTDTYHLDYDPNVNPQTRELRQFNENQPYRPYNPLVKSVDVPKYVTDILDDVPWEETTRPGIRAIKDPVTGEIMRQEIQQDIKKRDLNTFAPTLQTLANRVKQGNEEWSAYLRTQFRDRNGNLREPSDEEIAMYLTQLAIPLTGIQEDSNYKNQSLRDYYGKDYDKMTDQDSGTYPGGGTGITTGKNLSKLDIRIAGLKKRLKKGEYLPEDNDLFKGLLNRAVREENSRDMLNEDFKEQSRFLIKYMNDENSSINQTHSYDFTPVDSDKRKEMVNVMFGPTTSSGKLSADVASTVVRGATMYDYETGEELGEDIKKDLLKKDAAVNYVGPVADDYMAPMPGMHVVEIDGKRFMSTGSREVQREKRAMWNLMGAKRSTTGIGNTFVMQFNEGEDNPNPVSILDHTIRDDYGGDYQNIQEKGENLLYFKNVDDYQTGKSMVKVYAHNPMDHKILDNGNPTFIKEYDMNEEGGSMAVYKKILEERDELLSTKESVMKEVLKAYGR